MDDMEQRHNLDKWRCEACKLFGICSESLLTNSEITRLVYNRPTCLDGIKEITSNFPLGWVNRVGMGLLNAIHPRT